MKNNEMEVEYLADASVDAPLDAQIRGLLTLCFTKPQDIVFKDHRYFREPYPHRWVIRDTQETISAHVGVHEKTVEASGRTFPIGGIAEVCVHPEFRGRGYVKRMLACVHDWLIRHDFDFAVLFGKPDVYLSSGYIEVNNLIHDDVTAEGENCTSQSPAMVRPLSDTPWPDGQVYLPGPKF